MTTHRENATSFIEHSILTTSQFKRILLYIVKHVRFQDDKK